MWQKILERSFNVILRSKQLFLALPQPTCNFHWSTLDGSDPNLRSTHWGFCDFRVSSFPCPKVPRIGKMHVILVALGGVVKCDGTFKLETSSTWEFVVGLKPWWPNPFWGSWDSQWFSAGFPVGDRRFWPLLRLHLNFSCTLRFWTSDGAKGDDD